MPTKDEAHARVLALVRNYLVNKDKFIDQLELDTRTKFIDKMFEALGWDVYGNEIPDEVEREQSVRTKESGTKKADYTFKIDGITRLIVEAKALGVDIQNETDEKQAITYSYNRACSWAVLTNFVRTKIFFVSAKGGSIFYSIDFSSETDFDSNFKRLWYLSKQSVLEDSLEIEAKGRGIAFERIPIDQQLLNDLRTWRQLLSTDIKRRYPDKYPPSTIDEIVQRIVDRLIFIRKAEDSEFEDPILQQIVRRNNTSTYSEVKKLFATYKDHYDSKLFEEDAKSIHEADKIDISNDVIEKVIRGTIRPANSGVQYNFAAIDSDVLGGIYEQYLSYVLEQTPKNVKLQGGIAHRKEEGIYYTPTRIVDYIVRNTLGEVLKTHSPDSIAKITVLDPACGSGSFLIKAYDFIDAYYQRSKDYAQTKLHVTDDLPFSKRAQILQDHIFGVDLDQKAVQIAQLNLLMKIADKRQRLPLLQQNIRQGNSIIEDKSLADYSPFDWSEAFPKIIPNEGFDVIIGNPPYVFGGGQGITQTEKQYFKTHFDSAHGKLNLFSLFIERSVKLLKQGGVLGFIVPNTLLRVTSYQDTRKFILDHTKILRIVNLEAGVFQGVTASTIIMILQREDRQKEVAKHNVKIFEGIQPSFIEKPQNSFRNSLSIFDLSYAPGRDSLFAKITRETIQLGSICKEMIFGVVITKNFDEVVSDHKKNHEYKKFLEGKDIDRYHIKFSGKYLLYEKSKLHRSRTPEIFEANEKILVQRISGGNRPLKAAYDNEQYYDKESINNIIISNPDFDAKYILALLNSDLFNWYYASKFTNASTLTVNVSKAYLEQLPIKVIPKEKQSAIVALANQILSLNKRLDRLGDIQTTERDNLEMEIGTVESEINKAVFSLYGLSQTDTQLIEKSFVK